jgi:hypothetical protein
LSTPVSVVSVFTSCTDRFKRRRLRPFRLDSALKVTLARLFPRGISWLSDRSYDPEACILVNPDQLSKHHSSSIQPIWPMNLVDTVEMKEETHEETNPGFVDTNGDTPAVRCCAG